MAGLGSAASPWPRPAGGTAPARRSTGSWWSAGAVWASRRSRSSSSRCLERACRGRRGGGGRGLALPVAGRPPRPRPGGAARGRGGREGGARRVLSSYPRAAAPHSSVRPASRAASRESGFSGMWPGGRSWEGGKRRSTLSLRPGPEPFRRGSAAAPGFLPGGPRSRASSVGWSPALWVSSCPGRLPRCRCDRGGNLAARGSAWSPGFSAHAERELPASSSVFLFVCICAFF